MRKTVFLILLLLIAGLEMSARRQIDVQHNGQLPGHTDVPMYVEDPHDDQFEAYYDEDTNMLFFEGTGEVDFYYADIIYLSTMSTVLSTTVNGNYDAISMSPFSDGKYLLIIRMPSRLLKTTLMFEITTTTPAIHPKSFFD